MTAPSVMPQSAPEGAKDRGRELGQLELVMGRDVASLVADAGWIGVELSGLSTAERAQAELEVLAGRLELDGSVLREVA